MHTNTLKEEMAFDWDDSCIDQCIDYGGVFED